MSERFPDIEIYINKPDPAAVLAWLRERFESVEAKPNGRTFTLNGSIECVLTVDAVPGGFASLWLKSGQTPWPTDAECARDAFAAMGVEIRCSTDSWLPGREAGEETWLCINESGESEINWPS